MTDSKNVQLQESLYAQKQAINSLVEVLEAIPEVQVMFHEVFVLEVSRLMPGVNPDNVYIHAANTDGWAGGEPLGSLFEVFTACLIRGYEPTYDESLHGVYDGAEDDPERTRIKGLNAITIEKMLRQAIGGFRGAYRKHVEQYWTNGRQQSLELILARLFHVEVATAAAVGVMSASEAEQLTNLWGGAANARAIYNVIMKCVKGKSYPLTQAFIVPLAATASAQWVPEEKPGTCFLYTAARGIERFDSSLALHRVLLRRMGEPEELSLLMSEVAHAKAADADTLVDIVYNAIGDTTMVSRLLEKQIADLSHLFLEIGKHGSNFADVLGTVQHLQDVQAKARTRFARYLNSAANNMRPEWLKTASLVDQERHAALERAHLVSDIALHEHTRTASSFKAYVRSTVKDFLNSAAGVSLDPDHVFVLTRHEVNVGTDAKEGMGERKSLTEVFMWGVHDDAHAYELKLEEPQRFPLLTPTMITRAIKYLDLRVKYAAHRQSVYAQPSVQAAMRDNLSCVTALSLFRAGLQKHLTGRALGLVESFHLGNPAHSSFGVTLGARSKPLRDVVVYAEQSPQQGDKLHVLYAPGAPFEKEWFEFGSLEALQRKLVMLHTFPAGRDYLSYQLHAGERAGEGNLRLTANQLLHDRYFHTRFELMPRSAAQQQAFVGKVQDLIGWAAAEEDMATPAWYRKAPVDDRQLHTRLGTDKKIITERSRAWLSADSLNKFSRDLVSRVINDELSRRGNIAPMDPDQVVIKLKGQEYMSLTQLFIDWHLWERVHTAGGSMDELSDRYFPNVSSIRTVDGHEVKGLTRGLINRFIALRPADQYIEYLKGFASASDKSKLNMRCRYYSRLKQNQMLTAALEQKMQGFLSTAQFNWLKDMIDDLDLDPGTTPWAWTPRPEYAGIRAFHLAGRRVEGAYIFSCFLGNRWEHLLYLPTAQVNRRFSTFEQFSADFQTGQITSEITSLVKLADRGVVDSYIDKRSLAGVSWDAHTERQNHSINFYREEFVRGIDRVISDVDSTTVSLLESVIKDVLNIVDALADIASLFFPPVGLVVGVLRVLRGVVQGIVAYSTGDDKAANAYFASAWVQGIKIYLGAVAPVGIKAPGFDLLSRIDDMANIVTTLTGVPVGVDYITYLAD